MSMLDMPAKRTVYLWQGTEIEDWSNIVQLVIEERPDDDMKKIIHKALDTYKIPIKSANPEVQFYIDSFLTGANL